eukprot:5017066-Amphidinium_carterae.1
MARMDLYHVGDDGHYVLLHLITCCSLVTTQRVEDLQHAAGYKFVYTTHTIATETDVMELVE